VKDIPPESELEILEVQAAENDERIVVLSNLTPENHMPTGLPGTIGRGQSGLDQPVVDVLFAIVRGFRSGFEILRVKKP
jgi:hypothetical protein